MGNLIFFEPNYIDNASVTTSVADDTTIPYINDGDSDTLFLMSTTGYVQFDFDHTITVDSFLVLNHNAESIEVYSGDTTTSLTLRTTLATATALYYDPDADQYFSHYHVQTLTNMRYRFQWAGTPGASEVQIGQLIITKKMFQLTYGNYRHKVNFVPNQTIQRFYDGTSNIAQTTSRPKFEMDLEWDYIWGDINSIGGSDIDNIIDMCRRRKHAIIFPCGDQGSLTTAPFVSGFRAKDSYKVVAKDYTPYKPYGYNMASTPFRVKLEEVGL